MKIISEKSIRDFNFWGGAVATVDHIYNELGADGLDRLEEIVEEMYPDGIDETELNDLLWFGDATVYEWLGISDEDEDEDESDGE